MSVTKDQPTSLNSPLDRSPQLYSGGGLKCQESYTEILPASNPRYPQHKSHTIQATVPLTVSRHLDLNAYKHCQQHLTVPSGRMLQSTRSNIKFCSNLLQTIQFLETLEWFFDVSLAGTTSGIIMQCKMLK